LEHVEALLQLRGNNLPPVPRKVIRHHKRGQLRLTILRALLSGPLTGREIRERAQSANQTWSREQAINGVPTCLAHMRRAGLVRREGRLWSLNDVRSRPLPAAAE
jgi:hypothetical protein